MITAITYNGYDLQSGSVNTTEIQQFESSRRNLNIQSFVLRDGGKVMSTQFDPKYIQISGYIRADTKADLEALADTLKKNLLSISEKDLVIDYATGTRRYIATCSYVDFKRNNWNIDYLDFSCEFVVSNPPFGKDTAYSSIKDHGLTATNATTTTGTYAGLLDFGGTITPYPIIVMTFTSATGVREVVLTISNEDGFVSQVTVSQNINDGDILVFDLDNGKITHNNTAVDFSGGLPKFTLSNNYYILNIIGKIYSCDVTFRFYNLWL